MTLNNIEKENTLNQTPESFDTWAILEIMGHNKFAGRLTEQTIGGKGFIRIDIPPVDDCPGFTKFFGTDSVYSITPCTEEIARSVAKSLRQEPIGIYDLPEEWREKIRRPAIAGPEPYEDEEMDEDEEDWHR